MTITGSYIGKWTENGRKKKQSVKISLNFLGSNEAYKIFKLIIEKLKQKSQNKNRKSETSSTEENYLISESEHSEADDEEIRVQSWRDAQVSR